MPDAVSFDCHHCGYRYAVEPAYVETYGGAETTCVNCGGAFIVPGEVAPELEAAAAAAAAKAAAGVVELPRFWRFENLLVVRRGTKLPERCVKCNEAGVRRLTAKFSYLPEEYAACAADEASRLLMSTEATLVYSLCAEHVRRRRAARAAAAVPITGGLVVFVAFVSFGVPFERQVHPVVLGVSIALLAAGLLVFLFRRGTLEMANVTDRHVAVSGCGDAFLDSLPSVASMGD